jgi:uncharacterized lipoprotein YbaY
LIVSGEIVFPRAASGFKGANLVVGLIDTNLADAPGVILKEHRISNVSYDPTKPISIPFRLDLNDIPSEQLQTCSINVLVDLDRDGRISSGDFINMASYPVDLRRPDPHIVVTVKPVE